MEAPKELKGIELLHHAKALAEAHDAGEVIEKFIGNEWIVTPCPKFNGPLYLYRVQPKKIVRWLNLYPNDGLYASREEADRLCCSTRIACIRVEFTEGQYDN